jgi:hypothetical protein
MDLFPDGTPLPKEWMIRRPVIETRVRILAARERWQVLAIVPFSLVVQARPVTAGARWRFSFSRYDYTRGMGEPVLSSTSLHRRLDFHRQHEWGTLDFA